MLSGFVAPDGTLKIIPAARRKRGVVLRWLMAHFEDDVRYTESEVNASIQTHHPDCATLRRELIGHQMMAREDGIYWRLPESGWKVGGPA